MPGGYGESSEPRALSVHRGVHLDIILPPHSPHHRIEYISQLVHLETFRYTSWCFDPNKYEIAPTSRKI